MRITSLHIENFRDIESLDIPDLPDVTALFGRNGQGKTSVLHAIRMALFGRCPLTDARGAGADLLIRDGATEAAIEIGLDGAYTVSLTIGRKSRQWALIANDTGVIVADKRDMLWQTLGVSERHALIAAMPAEYLNSSDLGDVLAEYLCGDVTAEAVLTFAGDHAEWLTGFARKQRVALVDLAHLGSSAESARRDLNRSIKSEQARYDALPFVGQPMDTRGNAVEPDAIPRIEGQLSDLAKQRDELLQAVGAAAARRVAADIERDLRLNRESRPSLELEIQTATTMLENAAAELDRLNLDHANATAQCTAAENAAAAARRTITELAAMDTCPRCRRPLSDAARAEITAALTREAAEHDATAAKLAKQVGSGVTHIGRAHDTVSAARKARENADYALAKRDREIAALEAELANAGGLSADAAQAKLAETESRIERGGALLASLKSYAERAALEAWLTDARAESERLTWAVQAFRDGAAAKSLMRDGVSEFTAMCNTELQPFGHSLSIEVSGKTAEAWLDGRPSSHCSLGEQTLAAWAIAAAFGAAGCPVLLDDANHLDAGNRKALLKRLRENAPGTVIVAAAWQQSNEDMTAIADALAPVRVVWMDGGRYG